MANSFEEYLSSFLTENRQALFNKVIEERTKYLTVALEDIYQPHNASAVLRSCDCFGVQDVHIIENNNDYKVNPNVVMGATKWLTLNRYRKEENNTLECIQQLKNKGYRIVGTTPHNPDTTLHELPIDKPVALLFGNEKEGLSQLALDHTDITMKIPMYGFTESFNISVSAALCLNVLTERIRREGAEWQLDDDEKSTLKLDWLKGHVKNWEAYFDNYSKIEGNSI